MAETPQHARGGRLLFYCGGFSPVGGIEVFAHDLLVGMAGGFESRELLMWGRPPRRNPMVASLLQKGVAVTRQRWRWGCRWNWPDRLMVRRGVAAVRRADVVVFSKLFSPEIHRRLAAAAGAARGGGKRAAMVFVTAYRPAEMWGKSGPGAEMLDCFDAFVVQAASFAEDLRGYGYRRRVEVIPLMLPEDPRAVAVAAMPALDGAAPVKIGFLGRLEAQKNVGCLLAAFDRLRRADHTAGYELHIFGDGSQRQRLQAKAAQLGLGAAARFHGNVPHERVAQAIDSCHLFANSSLTEGQCLVALEVLSRGRPLVATAVGALPEVLSQPVMGRLTAPDDEAALAVALAEVAREVRDGRITPPAVRGAYDRQFGRSAVTVRYARLFEELAGR